MMSAPLPDWTAAVMRGCRSLALMNSNVTSAPSAFDASGACRLSSTSASGMKSTQRTMWSFVPCANAGAVRVASIPASPAPAMPTNVRRCKGVWLVIASSLVDLLELGFGPLHRVLGLHALDGLRVHVHDDVLRVGLGRLARRRAGMPEGARLARRLPEDLQGLVDLGPHRVLFPLLGGDDAVPFVDLEPLA